MQHSIQHIAATLKSARVQAKLSQRALSAKTKIPQAHISKIENGEVNLQTSSLIEISRALGLELMLIPRALVPAFEALISGAHKGSQKQVPKYRLDDQEDDDENE